MNLLLSPPIAFVIMLGAVLLFAAALSKISFKPKERSADEAKAYACGEDIPTHLMQPDYSQFFPFAFFFTILHVVALMVTTIPVTTTGSFAIAVLYLAGALVSLVILFRR
jgi:NADH-quinone oxidoreductase subunit A